MKQIPLFKDDIVEKKYSTKVGPPIYKPSKIKPQISELINTQRANHFIRLIKNANDITKEQKTFLLEASKRHNVFNYEKIADYYAHSNKNVQKYFEMLALVIIDYDRAIELGYASLSDNVRQRYIDEYE